MFTNYQLAVMENIFAKAQYPGTAVMSMISGLTDVPLVKIRNWFNNRRRTVKKQMGLDDPRYEKDEEEKQLGFLLCLESIGHLD